jgi:L-asparaginase
MQKTLTAILIIVCLVMVDSQMVMAAPENLPNVKILATGGTIAGTAFSSTQMTGYSASEIGIQALMDAVPQMKDYANVSGEQIFKECLKSID